MATVSSEVASSSPLERDARLVHADGHKVSPGELALGVIIGRTAESFDFFVYGIASVLVFPALLFPFAEPVEAMLYSFAIFSLAFIARPIGSVLFTEVDRRHGRGVKLTIALFLLGGSTASIAFLPSYEAYGALPIVVLAICRIGQGLALGGAWDGLAPLLSLNAPEKRRGLYTMMPQLGSPFGFIVASALFYFFYANLAQGDFLTWGWRYPFFVAFTINVVALFARLRLLATEEYVELLQKGDLLPESVWTIVSSQWKYILIGAFVPLATFALFHIVTIFPLSYIDLYTERSVADFLLLQLGGAVLASIGVVLSGLIADRFGRRNLIAACAALIALFGFATPSLLGGGPEGETIFVLAGFSLLGLALGQSTGATASNFRGRSRYTGSGLTTDIAWLIGAGFAPLVALGFSSRFGLVAVAIYLLSGAVSTLAALYVNRRLQLHAA
ncbi:MFS transporter [Terrihabitans rhizophilus]|uniref:MFS transporter n=1 Tax=Terrihabitans rhizophilus TaxID=3092662 RepID=A0ABU4RNQ2_9HYPH|nr:MFS transporter [Terrihabitans sp. PJ23]MDX6805828.1 MFS transporter [Terrihabitans sp. PJ23]